MKKKKDSFKDSSTYEVLLDHLKQQLKKPEHQGNSKIGFYYRNKPKGNGNGK